MANKKNFKINIKPQETTVENTVQKTDNFDKNLDSIKPANFTRTVIKKLDEIKLALLLSIGLTGGERQLIKQKIEKLSEILDQEIDKNEITEN